MTEMKNALFYKYVEIKDLEETMSKIRKICEDNEILGKILVGEEGINGCVSGTKEDIKKFINSMKEDKRFEDIDFKVTNTTKHDFRKLIVRERKEIVTSRFGVSHKDAAPYIEPKELKEALDGGKEIYLVDMRNEYEADIGKFKDAIVFEVDTFRDIPEKLKDIEHLKDKEIVTYCTGGIRCEKASALLKKKGFKNVKQLHGGIIKYGLENGNKHWEGKCFVFDDRLAIDLDPNKQNPPIARCCLCGNPEDQYYNCKKVECDARHIACEKCHEVLEGYCSKRCRNEVKRKEELLAMKATEA